MSFRIGFGYDVHKLETAHSLILGGIQIPHEKGTLGHSDADVLTHAICDALLGAAALGDIGKHFPDTDSKYKDISSLILLKQLNELLISKGFIISNIDTTIALQKPRLRDHIDQIRKKLANVLELNINQVSVKATTTEELGFEGREEGISAYAVVLINSKKDY